MLTQEEAGMEIPGLFVLKSTAIGNESGRKNQLESGYHLLFTGLRYFVAFLLVERHASGKLSGMGHPSDCENLELYVGARNRYRCGGFVIQE